MITKQMKVTAKTQTGEAEDGTPIYTIVLTGVEGNATYTEVSKYDAEGFEESVITITNVELE